MTSQANIDAPELPDSEKKEYQIVGDITWVSTDYTDLFPLSHYVLQFELR